MPLELPSRGVCARLDRLGDFERHREYRAKTRGGNAEEKAGAWRSRVCISDDSIFSSSPVYSLFTIPAR
jgi:hypothetical protein